MMPKDYRSIRNLFVFGLFTMAVMVGVGFYTGSWTVVGSGIFSASLIIFSSRKLFGPMKWLKKVGAPASFDAEARSLQQDMAPLLPFQRGGKKLGDIEFPYAALVTARITRQGAFTRVMNAADHNLWRAVSSRDAAKKLEERLQFLDEEPGHDLDAVAEVLSGYFAALVEKSIVPTSGTQLTAELKAYAALLQEGGDVDGIVTYMNDLGPTAALAALQQGIPLELARAVFAEVSDD
jgi:hypothetical protein